MLRSATFAAGSWRSGVLSRVLTFILLLSQLSSAAFIVFQNCLDPAVVNSSPLQLQFIPYFFDATFDTVNPAHPLNVSIYGNVSGQATEGTYPPPDSPSWTNPQDTFGKITDVGTGNNYSTLFHRYQVVTYDVYDAPATRFCNSTVNDTCPLVPSFNGSKYDPYSLSAFAVGHAFEHTYAFSTITTTIRVESGDIGGPIVACISANITPDLGTKISGLLTWLPAAVLACVAVGTAAAAIWSPWGTSDPFCWTTNYGRDEDLLRMVTPGFGDCLQYIQFIFLTGALTLEYPGFYQPATSQAAWSSLMFNESFVSHGNGYQSLVDGIYATNGTYGMTTMSQLVGMTMVKDIWACMAVWLVVIAAAAIFICQSVFALRWVYRAITDTTEEDLRQKNWPLTAGMIVRIVYNYFLFPIVAISMFQLVVAPRSPVSVVVVAVILLLGIIVFAGWILRVIFRTKPRAHLFDDLPTVLLYGSLYNTYSDEAAPFALIPAVITFMRGIAVGAVQPSGIASLVILAICEVIFILTLQTFKPFQTTTSMNLVHTLLAAVRLATVLLMVAFVPSLGVTEAPKGWIGYAILLLHAAVLVLVFFLNSLQKMLEVAARLAGAAADPQHGAQRGGLVSYSWRQLRNRQKAAPRRGSMTSDAAILANDSDAKSLNLINGRSRSLSASSQMLLNSDRLSGFDHFSQPGTEIASTPGQDTPSATSGLPSAVPSSSGTGAQKPVLGIKTEQPLADPYYRPPRARRNTIDPYTPGARSRQSGASGEWARPYEDWPETPGVQDSGEGPSSSSGRGTPSPAHHRHQRAMSDPEADQGPRPDYAVREVDFYYGVRGPALSKQPARKRKTGPADPMGPVSSATSFFQKMFGGKTKEKGKGFEVIRSSRAPTNEAEAEEGVGEGQELQTSPRMSYPPYSDAPNIQAVAGAEHEGAPVTSKATRRMPLDGPWDGESGSEDEGPPPARSSAAPPFLAPIERTPSLSVPFPERANSRNTADQTSYLGPAVPRRSSRRTGSRDISQDNSPYTSPRLPSHSETERPTSMGLVQQRMARDSVFQSGIGEGSRAEFVENERTMSFD